MNLVDTHCHIQSAGLTRGERTTRQLWAKDPRITVDELVANAQEAGVGRMICVGCDVDDSQLAIECVKTRENLYASIGIHPHEAARYAHNEVEKTHFMGLVTSSKVVAIGECGLDYFYKHSPKADQLEILKFQLEMAKIHHLPMIFHVREAFSDFWPVFGQYEGVRGVLHSFTDSAENMRKAVSKGLFIGVNGIATFSKQPEQLEMYKQIPLKNLLLETDAPFLTPVPFRGKICQPKHIVVIAEFLAELRGETVQEIAEATTNNARKLFNI